MVRIGFGSLRKKVLTLGRTDDNRFHILAHWINVNHLVFEAHGHGRNAMAQPALAVIGNIAIFSNKNKGKIINLPFTGDEFTWSPSVAQ